MKRYLGLVVVGLLISSDSLGAIVDSGVTSVASLDVYPTLNQGGVIFTIADPIAGCSGYWLNPSSSGYKDSLSVLLSAYHAKASVLVSGRTDVTWPHSANPWCEVYRLKLTD